VQRGEILCGLNEMVQGKKFGAILLLPPIEQNSLLQRLIRATSTLPSTLVLLGPNEQAQDNVNGEVLPPPMTVPNSQQ